MDYRDQVCQERPLSEGDQIKAAIRELFTESRNGTTFTQTTPLRRAVGNVNGSGEVKVLCLVKHEKIKGAVVMWYEDA